MDHIKIAERIILTNKAQPADTQACILDAAVHALIAIAEQLRSTNAQLGAISAILDDAIRAYLEAGEPIDNHPADLVEQAGRYPMCGLPGELPE